jgi:hypothetical protein
MSRRFLLEELAETSVLGEQLQHLSRHAVGPRTELRQVVPLDAAQAGQAEVEERLVPHQAHVVGKTPHAVQDLPTSRPLLLQKPVHETGEEASLRLHDPRDALVGVDVGEEKGALGNHAHEVAQLQVVHRAVGDLPEAQLQRFPVERFHVPRWGLVRSSLHDRPPSGKLQEACPLFFTKKLHGCNRFPIATPRWPPSGVARPVEGCRNATGGRVALTVPRGGPNMLALALSECQKDRVSHWKSGI